MVRRASISWHNSDQERISLTLRLVQSVVQQTDTRILCKCLFTLRRFMWPTQPAAPFLDSVLFNFSQHIITYQYPSSPGRRSRTRPWRFVSRIDPHSTRAMARRRWSINEEVRLLFQLRQSTEALLASTQYRLGMEGKKNLLSTQVSTRSLQAAAAPRFIRRKRDSMWHGGGTQESLLGIHLAQMRIFKIITPENEPQMVTPQLLRNGATIL